VRDGRVSVDAEPQDGGHSLLLMAGSSINCGFWPERQESRGATFGLQVGGLGDCGARTVTMGAIWDPVR
jgi:hypothetical protein